MAFAVTLGEMVSSCQQLGNQPNADQLAVTEWKQHISTYYGRLHTCVADTGARCFETTATINLSNLALPADHKSTIGVDFWSDAAGTHRLELPELMVQERNVFGSQTGQARAWWLSGTNLALGPVPSTGTYKHIYVPQPARYNASADTTSIDFLTSDGYEAVLWGVASVALHRAESAQARAIDEHTKAMDALKEWAVRRAQTMPKRRQITNINARSWDVNGIWNPASWRYNP
ncbi:MAG: hypothetical protein ACM358_11890 [Gemmatimonadota bacterium]